MSRRTALVTHVSCALHDTGWGHPEHQGRLPAITRALYRETPALLEWLAQEEAPVAELTDVLKVHTHDHVEAVRRAVDEAERAGQPVDLTLDTVVSGASMEAALGAAGAAIRAAELVLEEGGPDTAFALTRPPGHHATAGRPMGFCLFNNAAIAAKWARSQRGLERIFILDWDVHHGNGTQDIFYHDPSVFYASLHLTGHYPGTGHVDEKGVGAGIGFTRNVPLPAGVEREYYREVFEEVVTQVTTSFQPELIIISAGFDLLAGDPLGGLILEPSDLHWMAGTVMGAARGSAAGRVVAVLEGGYVPERVGEGVVQVVRAFAGLPPDDRPGSAD